jgi:hypothetical protein
MAQRNVMKGGSTELGRAADRNKCVRDEVKE